MAYATFVHRPDSIYDDRPDRQYQFPRQYLSRVQRAVGDWIIYYEPTKVTATRGYFAMARVERVVEDPTTSGMYLALIEPGSYLRFPLDVPFMLPGGQYTERGLLNEAGALSGRAQAAVRALSPEDFHRIVAIGLSDDSIVLPRQSNAPPFDVPAPGFAEELQIPFTLSRPIRDRVFRTIVLRAYDERCAVTGLKLINGGGRAEVAAAHIRPVEANGPDIVQNGVALSGTAHWMFDRGLISFSDDLDVLVSRHVNDRDSVEALINPTGRMIGPTDPRMRPHPEFLSWHRENCFKL
jgi:putative restriction endonuclease